MYDPDGKSHAPFRAQVRKWDDEQVLDAAAQVRALQDHPGWQVLAGLLGAEDERITHGLRYMPISDHAAMARAVGYSAGMTSHVAALETVLEEGEKRTAARQARADREEELVR